LWIGRSRAIIGFRIAGGFKAGGWGMHLRTGARDGANEARILR
jgi:hypothetical protein